MTESRCILKMHEREFFLFFMQRMKLKEIISRIERSFSLKRKRTRVRWSPRRMREHGTAHPTTSNLTVALRARGVIPRGVKIKPWEASCSPKGKILTRRTGRNCGLCRLSTGRVESRRVAHVFSVYVKTARVFALKFME